MARGNKRAQSILEYVVVLTAIVAIIIYAAGQWIKAGVGQTLTNAATAIEDAASQIAPSPPPPPPPSSTSQ